MLFVYAIIRPALPGYESSAASAPAPLSTQIRMEGMEVYFICHSRSSDSLQSRIHAAQCVQQGGAGLVIPDGSGYAVIHHASAAEDENSILRASPGLTLRLQGSAAHLAAVADAVSFLRAQAAETGSLASALEDGETNASSVCALLNVYKTQGTRVQDALASLPHRPETALLLDSVNASLTRIDAAIASTTPGSLHLVHAAACAQWLTLLEELAA